MSACTGACAVNWPPLRVRGTPLVGSGAKPSDVGTTTRPDGTSQLTYNGHPLYTFANDKKPGDTNGEGISAFGGSWFAVSRGRRQGRPSLATAGRRRLRQRLLTIPARRDTAPARREER